MSRMHDHASFENQNTLKEFLAEQLVNGRLSLALGAGASMGFGLPNWDNLIADAFAKRGLTKPTALTNEHAADALLAACGNDDLRFASLISEVLYSGIDLSMVKLKQKELLAALGAITMASSRGSVGRVVSFNYDNLLETYLDYYGFDVESIAKVPHWDSRTDVKIYHPHGFLPSDKIGTAIAPIVLAQSHYDRIVGKTHVVWNSVLLEIFSSSTMIFIGLSGADNNLTSLLQSANDNHVSKARHDAFWGIRFSDSVDDARSHIWQMRGVFQVTLSSYEEIPGWLFEVCQIAAQKRRRHRGG